MLEEVIRYMHNCPRCGAAEGTKRFVGPFCIDCYQFNIKVPDKVELQQCKRCQALLLRGRWIEYSERKIKDYVESKFKGEFTGSEFLQHENKAKFTIERDGATVVIDKEIPFKLNNDICPECNKKAGGYFEAIIQLRGNDDRIIKYTKIFEERLEESGTFITKILDLKEGRDIYVGSTKATLSILKELGLTHTISSKLAGQKQGKRLYRTSFAIRL